MTDETIARTSKTVFRTGKLFAEGWYSGEREWVDADAYRSLMRALECKQAKIDALMLEFCPGEMSAAQKAEWARHQRAAPETCEQQAIAEDVRLLGIGFAMHTAAGVKRLAPEDVTFRPPLRCLAMINEFADKVCSLPESHGGSHVWVTPEKAHVVACGNPVMVAAGWYGPCTKPSGHDGECERATANGNPQA